ncbi:MAG: hypothetical protein LIO71_07840 [Ruminococcus sp.]|nr:hypothetical protein [Ruminococcus sp.]MCD7800567.1 hypothetical protein [Ruminococcus sp.]
MGKHLVYIAGAFAIIVIMCSMVANTGSDSVQSKPIVTNQVSDVQIDGSQVTTNIWDYIRSQKENDTIGESNENNTTQQSETQLTIILQ